MNQNLDILYNKYINIKNNEVIIMGDLNINLNENRQANNDVDEYINIISNKLLKQIINIPTRVASHSETIIDHLLYGHKLLKNNLMRLIKTDLSYLTIILY